MQHSELKKTPPPTLNIEENIKQKVQIAVNKYWSVRLQCNHLSISPYMLKKYRKKFNI